MTKRATKRSATASDTIRKLVDVRSTFSCEENRLQGYQLPKDKTVISTCRVRLPLICDIPFKKMLIWRLPWPNGRITLTCVTLSMTSMLPRAVKTGRKTRERPQ